MESYIYINIAKSDCREKSINKDYKGHFIKIKLQATWKTSPTYLHVSNNIA
jgi:hypothetical protein